MSENKEGTIARQITSENYREIAEWCGRIPGVLADTHHDGPREYILLGNDRMAVVTDWVVKTGDNFNFITDEEYLAILVSEEKDAERFQKVFDLVKQAMVLQDADTYNGHESSTQTDGVAFGITQKILEIM